ncbi:hypothetical protein [Sutterella wadsworthensis]|uniref:hypothetical protein n=1 Tax=Sutterella wadsworthensis TaxID=40545 RepID=UPI00242CEA65|nr:hypothetical protein [Sutterella wadsworthensis]
MASLTQKSPSFLKPPNARAMSPATEGFSAITKVCPMAPTPHTLFTAKRRI